MKVIFDMRGYTNLFTNTVAIPDHNRLVVKKVFPFQSHHKEDCVFNAHAHVAVELSVLAINQYM